MDRNPDVVPGHIPTNEPRDPEPIDASVARIAAAIERIERTLDRRPAGSRRQSALVQLLGEAPRVSK